MFYSLIKSNNNKFSLNKDFKIKKETNNNKKDDSCLNNFVFDSFFK